MTAARVDDTRLIDLPRHFVAALRARELYPVDHPLVRRHLAALGETLGQLLVNSDTLTIGVVAGEMVVGAEPVAAHGDLLTRLLPQLQQADIERICFTNGVTQDELAIFIDRVATAMGGDARAGRPLPHITIDRIRASMPDEEVANPVATAQRVYGTARDAAELAWQTASDDGAPDIRAAKTAVSELAEIASSHRPTLLALTAVQQFHSDTFSHMVNVAVLTLAQARTLGIDGRLLNDIGLAAMMHDIGKVRTPPEILTKPGPLTPQELAIMQHHVVDGAEILCQMADVPPLAPIVAFEHHLRFNGTGYPSVTRQPINLATSLCSIADVYDAMRMHRDYQDALPSDRILAVLERNDRGEFNPHLVRRFVQLMGIYPAGTLVRLSSHEIAVILKAHAPDPYSPMVKVVRDANGETPASPEIRPLWKTSGRPDGGATIDAPLDPSAYGIEPLQHL